METNNEKLAHVLKLKFGTSHFEPTEAQVNEIKLAILAIIAAGGTPAESDWQRIVAAKCPSAGKYKYAGQDTSDLATLLELAKNKSGK